MAPSQFTVAILPLGNISAEQIELTADVLKKEFGANTIVLPAKEVPSQYFITERGRYQAFQLLTFLFFQLPVGVQRMIAIIDGGLEFHENQACLGYASFEHRVALYSVPHLLEQSTGQTKITAEEKNISHGLIVHEIAHTLGVKHCDNEKCIMDKNPFNKSTLCDKCRKWVNRELQVLPGSAEDCFSLAESFYLYNCFDEATTLYRKAIRLAPREPLYYQCLYVVLHTTKQFSEATMVRVAAVTHSDDRPGFNYTCGITHLKIKELKEAEECFAKALAVNKDPQKMSKLIGQAYREILHDVERASRHYKEYLQLGGNDQDVIDWLISRSQLDTA